MTCERVPKYNTRYYLDYDASATAYPSVTSILKIVSNDFSYWREQQARLYLQEHMAELTSPEKAIQILNESIEHSYNIRNESAEFGNVVHEQIEHALNNHNILDSLEPDVSQNIENAVNFVQMQGIKPLNHEYMIFHKPGALAPGFGGTIDFIGETFEGEVIIIDWKTTKTKQKTHLFQIAAYAYGLAQYCALEKPPRGMVYYTKDDTYVEADMIHDWIKFVKIAHAWDVMHKFDLFA